MMFALYPVKFTSSSSLPQSEVFVAAFSFFSLSLSSPSFIPYPSLLHSNARPTENERSGITTTSNTACVHVAKKQNRKVFFTRGVDCHAGVLSW